MTSIGRPEASNTETLEKGPRDRGVLILADSVAAIRAVKKAGRTGKARTGELARVLREVKKREVQRQQSGGGSGVRFAWVRAHVGIPGNGRADQQAKFYTRVAGSGVPTEESNNSSRPGGWLNVPRWAGVGGEWQGGAGGRPLGTPTLGTPITEQVRKLESLAPRDWERRWRSVQMVRRGIRGWGSCRLPLPEAVEAGGRERPKVGDVRGPR